MTLLGHCEECPKFQYFLHVGILYEHCETCKNLGGIQYFLLENRLCYPAAESHSHKTPKSLWLCFCVYHRFGENLLFLFLLLYLRLLLLNFAKQRILIVVNVSTCKI